VSHESKIHDIYILILTLSNPAARYRDP